MANELDPESQIVVQAPAQAESTFSKTTVARARLTALHLTATKASMINDMAVQRLDPTQTLKNIIEVQDIQTSLDSLTAKIVAESAPDAPFTDPEVEDMRAIKKEFDLTDQKLADLYDTNQTKINRLLNNQTR